MKKLAKSKLHVICATSTSTDCAITHCDFAHAHVDHLCYYCFVEDIPQAYCLSQVSIHRLFHHYFGPSAHLFLAVLSLLIMHIHYA